MPSYSINESCNKVEKVGRGVHPRGVSNHFKWDIRVDILCLS